MSLDLRHSISRHIVVGGYYATVFYSGQEPFCGICKKDHLTSRCPLKGKCHFCREVGHVGRFYCPQRDGCSECGEGEHVRLDCPSRVECRLCGNLCHLPEDCPSIVVVHPSQSLDEAVDVLGD